MTTEGSLDTVENALECDSSIKDSKLLFDLLGDGYLGWQFVMCFSYFIPEQFTVK